MARDRTGKFWWEYKKPHYITLQSMRGVYDPALSSDCRCGRECSYCEFGNYCEFRPWVVLGSTEFWGEEILTPEGLPDGDTLDPDAVGIPFEDRIACDIYGRPYYLYEDDNEEDQEISDAMYFEQERQKKEFFEDLEDDEYCPLYPDGFKEITQERIAKEEHSFKDDFDPICEVLTAEIHFSEKANDYDNALDDLPKILSKSHRIISDRCRDSKKDIRRMIAGNGSSSHGWRGDDRYKDERTGKVRVSIKKFCKVADKIGYPFVDDLIKERAPRLVRT